MIEATLTELLISLKSREGRQAHERWPTQNHNQQSNQTRKTVEAKIRKTHLIHNFHSHPSHPLNQTKSENHIPLPYPKTKKNNTTKKTSEDKKKR